MEQLSEANGSLIADELLENGEESIDVLRFVIVAIIGNILACFSIVSSCLVFYALIRKKSCRKSQAFYWAVLAPFDVCVSTCYILLLVVYKWAVMCHSLPLMSVWWHTFRLTFTASNMAKAASSYILLAATTERFLVATKRQKLAAFAKERRFLACCFAFGLSFLIQFSSYWEFEAVRYEDDVGTMYEYYFNMTSLTTEPLYSTFKFYVRNILGVFLPFILLSLLNGRIIARLRQQSRWSKLFRFDRSEHKARLRDATRLLVVIVTTYLLTNVLNVVITAWEYLDLEGLMSNANFYDYSSDAVSLLSVVACAVRLPAYWATSPAIRKAILAALGRRQHHSSSSKLARFPQQLLLSPKEEEDEEEETSEGVVEGRRDMHLARGSGVDMMMFCLAAAVVAKPPSTSTRDNNDNCCDDAVQQQQLSSPVDTVVAMNNGVEGQMF